MGGAPGGRRGAAAGRAGRGALLWLILAALVVAAGRGARGAGGVDCAALAGRRACRRAKGDCFFQRRRGCQRTAANGADCMAITRKRLCRRAKCRWMWAPIEQDPIPDPRPDPVPDPLPEPEPDPEPVPPLFPDPPAPRPTPAPTPLPPPVPDPWGDTPDDPWDYDYVPSYEYTSLEFTPPVSIRGTKRGGRSVAPGRERVGRKRRKTQRKRCEF